MRQGNKYISGFLLTPLVLVSMLVIACEGGAPLKASPTAAARASQSQQILRIPLPISDISTLDPALATDLYSDTAIDAVFTGMVQLNDKLEVVPQIASSFTHSSDGLTWTFYLKHGITFSDGTSLTSQDVVYSIDRALSPQVSSLNGVTLTYLGLIRDSDMRVAGKISTIINDSLLTPDNYTIVIKLNKPGAYFLQALTYPFAYVVEKKLIHQYGLKFVDHLSDKGGQGGAGPFVLSNYDHNKGITLVPNHHYYGKKPQLSQLQYLFIKTVATQNEMYQADQLDMANIPAGDLQQAEKSKEFVKTPQLSNFYFSMNYLTKPFNNIKIRQAFSMALNKDVIATSLYKGAFIPSCHIVPIGMRGYNPNLTCPGGASTSGDQKKARQLLQQGMREEGYAFSNLPTITLTYWNGQQDVVDLMTTTQQMWQTVLGVDIKLRAIDATQLVTEVTNTMNNQRGLQLWYLGWIADYPDPQDWTTLQFDKGSPNNSNNYGQNSSFDAVQQQQVQQQLEQADITSDQTQRILMYKQAEQQLVNDVAWLPMFQVNSTRLVKSYVVGLTFNAVDLQPPDDWAKVYIALH